MQSAVTAQRKVSTMYANYRDALDNECIAFALATGVVDFTSAEVDRNAERSRRRMRVTRRRNRLGARK